MKAWLLSVVDVGSRVGVLGECARVGFAVGADSVSDSKDAARLLDVRLRRESSGGDGGGGLRVSEGVRRSLYSGEGVSVALSVVARDGSSVVLDDGDCGACCVGVLLRPRGMLIRCWGRLSRRLIVGLVSGCRVRVMWCCRRRVGVFGWSRLRAMRVTRMSDALAGV